MTDKPQPKNKPRKPEVQKPLSGVAKLAAAQKARDAADAGADDDLDAFVKSNACNAPDAPPDGHGVMAALADAALAQAMKGRGRLRARLAAGRAVAVVVVVPDSSWVSAVDDAVRRAAPTVKVVARDGSMRSQHKPSHGNADVALTLANGRAVVGVASSPEAVLPSALVACADARLDLAPPSGRALRRLLRRFARGPVPRDLGKGCASLSLDETVACFRAGAAARDVLANFARAVARKAGGGRGDDVPVLRDLPGFSGEARTWGQNLVDGFARWRGNSCAFRDLDASAVLAGPPGAGKTYFARSLARSLSVPLHVTSVGDWFARSDGALGGVVQRFTSVWDAAMVDARAGGALLLIDEMDAIPDRAQLTDRGREWWTGLIAQILTVTDGAATDRTGLALLGCTNAGSSAAPASTLDAALLRPGRFGRVIWVGLPTDADLCAVVSHWLGGALSPESLLPAVRLARDASVADAAAWARDARTMAAAAGRAVAVADVVAAVAPPDGRPADMVRRAAVHEAGHAVAAVHLNFRVQGVSIVQDGRSGGHTAHDLPLLSTASDVARATVVALAGRAAEEAILGAPSSGAEGDLAAATALVASAHASQGLGGESLVHLAPRAEASSLLLRDPALRRAVEAAVRRGYGEALAAVGARRDAVERVADALVARRVLSGDEVEALAAGTAGRARRAARTRTGGGHDA